MKVAVVTPYYKEETAILRQCHDSVLSQAHLCQHILVADGHPQSWIEKNARTEHVILPLSNGDNGNTPRGIGSILAESWGFDAVAYLDADNWFAPSHIASLVQLCIETGAPVAASSRTYHKPDGSELAICEPEEDDHSHVDTSCFLITRAAFELFPIWFMPKPLSPICDRVFLRGVRQRGFRIAFTDKRTVAFRTQYAVHYRTAGLEPPPEAKEQSIFAPVSAYLADVNNRNAFARRHGFDL